MKICSDRIPIFFGKYCIGLLAQKKRHPIFLFAEFVWSQEEHQNCGAWSFVQPRFANLIGIRNLSYAGRSVLCQPAVGVGQVHQREIAQLMDMTFQKIR